jgi:predicted enzyme related to lactoylglutathione lyase
MLSKGKELSQWGFWASCAVEDLQKEYERLKKLGVVWTQEPTPMGPATVTVFDDTCGNPIQFAQAKLR